MVPLAAVLKNPTLKIAGSVTNASWDLAKHVPQLMARGEQFPAELNTSFTFADPGGNQALDAEERATLVLTVTNTGKGSGFVKIKVGSNRSAAEVMITQDSRTVKVSPNTSAVFTVGLAGSQNLSEGSAQLTIETKEARGYDANSVVAEIATRSVRPPVLVLAGVQVDDDKQGASFGDGNGVIIPGEQVELTFVIQNQGTGTAENVALEMQSHDQNVTVRSVTGGGPSVNMVREVIGVMKPGDVVKKVAVVAINRLYKGAARLPVQVKLVERRPRFAVAMPLPVSLRQRQNQVQLVKVAAKYEGQVQFDQVSVGAEVDKPLPFPALPVNENAWALIIGVEEYKNAPAATFTARDAQRMRDTLVHLGVPPENVKMLLNGSATLGAMRAAFGWLKNNAVDKDSTVYVYFAGHGVPHIETQQAYLVPADGDPNYPKETGYPVAEIKKQLSHLPSRRVALFLDACFSSMASRSTDKNKTLLADARPLVIRAKLGAEGRNLATMAAAGPSEVSVGDPALKHGLFTNYLLMGLRGHADKNQDGSVTLAELHSYVSSKVPRHARRLNRTQNPSLSGANKTWPIRFK